MAEGSWLWPRRDAEAGLSLPSSLTPHSAQSCLRGVGKAAQEASGAHGLSPVSGAAPGQGFGNTCRACQEGAVCPFSILGGDARPHFSIWSDPGSQHVLLSWMVPSCPTVWVHRSHPSSRSLKTTVSTLSYVPRIEGRQPGGAKGDAKGPWGQEALAQGWPGPFLRESVQLRCLALSSHTCGTYRAPGETDLSRDLWADGWLSAPMVTQDTEESARTLREWTQTCMLV